MAHVMASQSLPPPKAFRVVKKAHRPPCPNEWLRGQLKLFWGMGCQLKLFWEMGCQLDGGNAEFRLFKLQTRARA